MSVEARFKEIPLSETGRKLMILNLALILALVITPIAYYFMLPSVVPSHWNMEGEVTSYSSKLDMIILLATLMPLANVIIVLVVAYRWTLLNKYPYLINISAIAVLLATKDVDAEKRSRVVNRIFEVTLGIGAIVGIYMWGLEILILESMAGHEHTNLLLAYSIGATIILLAAAILMYRRIYQQEIQPSIIRSTSSIK